MKHFTSVHDVSDINALVEKALAYKKDPLQDKAKGSGKSIGLLFMNPSMRTRISTQVAAANLGMDSIVFNIDKEGWKLELEDGAVMNGTSVEHIKDAAPVFGSYFDVIGVRTFPSLVNKEEDYSEVLLNSLIKYSGLPVVSLESSTLHPLQSFADVISIAETKQKKRPKVVMAWAPHIKPLPQCVPNSFAEWMTVHNDADFVITHPEGYELHTKYTNGATIEYDQQKALQDADYVYVKNWSAYEDYGKLLPNRGHQMLNLEALKQTNDAKIMHCLPVRRNVELSDELLDSSNSIVTRQAGNRVWAAQTVLSEILNQL